MKQKGSTTTSTAYFQYGFVLYRHFAGQLMVQLVGQTIRLIGTGNAKCRKNGNVMSELSAT